MYRASERRRSLLKRSSEKVNLGAYFIHSRSDIEVYVLFFLYTSEKSIL